MNKENKSKRWIAAALALVIFLVSIITGNSKNKIEEEQSQNIIDKYSSNLTNLFLGGQEEHIQGTNLSQRIMVLDVDGVIQDGDSYETLMADLKSALSDQTIAGIILRVNSPGGSVYNSEQIHNAITKVQKERQIPVYTVMETMAASGGYYISAPTDKIFASNETFTGSIGVIMQSYSLQGLFEKYGVKEQTITTGEMKAAGSYGSDLTDSQREYLQNLCNSAFSRFVKVVADGREMSEKDVKKLADGRVYDGSQAVENGLIDEIGDFDKALGEMIENTGLEDPYVFQYSNSLTGLTSIFSKAKESLSSNSDSDLKTLKELMDKGYALPMYMYGE